MAFLLSASRPNSIDSPRRKLLTRPMCSLLNTQSRLAEFPPETISIDISNVASINAASLDNSPIFSASGEAPLVQGKHATGRCHAKYEVVGYRDSLLQSFREISANRNRVGFTVKHHAGVEARFFAGDYR